MRTFVVVPPAPVVTWEEANAHLQLDDDIDQQPFVDSLIDAATAHLDGPTGWLGRAVGVQTLEARCDGFDCGSIRLRYPPVIDVVSVKYVDSAGVEQTIAGANYELMGASLASVYGGVWPTPRWQREAVRIRYRAGHDPDDPVSAGALAIIKQAILLMVGDMYRFRETATPGNVTVGPVQMSTTIENLLSPLRVWI